MSSDTHDLPDISAYTDLLDRFLGGEATAPEFEKSFLAMMKTERRTIYEPAYPVLQRLFEDADAYVEQPELRTEPDDLDDAQLLERARRAGRALYALGFE
jgi:hypothetical protein